MAQGATAGAGTSTPNIVPPANTARKLSHELRRLGPRNNPGHSEIEFDRNAPRMKERNLDAAKQEFMGILTKFDVGCEELIRISEPIDPGNEIAVVDQYVHL